MRGSPQPAEPVRWLYLQADGVYAPSIKATTAHRYVCVNTNGKLMSQIAACRGT
jgi:hypothetical protein